MSTCNPYNNVSEVLYILLGVLCLWNLVCVTLTAQPYFKCSQATCGQRPPYWQSGDKATCVGSEKQVKTKVNVSQVQG